MKLNLRAGLDRANDPGADGIVERKNRWAVSVPLGLAWGRRLGRVGTLKKTDTATALPNEMTPEVAAEEATMAVLGEEARKGLGKERRQIVLLVLVVGAFMLLANFTPLRAWLENAQEWKRYVKEFGWMSRAIFLGATALAVMLGVPRLALAGAAGLLFGFTEGLVLSLLGSTLGSYGTFLMIRRGFRKSMAVQAKKRPWLAKLLEKPSLLKVFWVRQLVLPGVVLNAVLGVAETRHRTFLGGTLLGYIPLNVAATLVGSGLGKSNLAQSAVQLMAALAVINGVVWLLWRRFKKRGATELAASR